MGTNNLKVKMTISRMLKEKNSITPIAIKFFILTLLLICLVPFIHSQVKSTEEIEFRQNRGKWMRSEKSPLALAGLFWLKPGENSFGTSKNNDIVLPFNSAPKKVGTFTLTNDQTQISVENPSAKVFLNSNNKPIKQVLLKSDAANNIPDQLRLNNLRMKIIKRGDRFAVRLINLKNPPLLNFSQLDFYDVSLEYKVEGQFIPYQPAKKIEIVSVIGVTEKMTCPGIIHFQLQGKKISLEPVIDNPQDKELFIMFKDATNGKETYGGGRFLYANLPQNGKVTLNFNLAHNPYCAYSPYSTCPIPPMQNWLKIAIRAGEKKYLNKP